MRSPQCGDAVVVEEIVREGHADTDIFAALVLVGGFAPFTLLSSVLRLSEARGGILSRVSCRLKTTGCGAA